jgi:hypothetical protein
VAAAVAVAMKWLVWRVVNMVLLIRGAACWHSACVGCNVLRYLSLLLVWLSWRVYAISVFSLALRTEKSEL